uniref:Exostosin GT47 domain-containing protein n=1 Tax=Physcomitrium patens TaxID=3218 RepID=A0A2K1L0N0_PHYPA|nr:hypothetical protein PHYPA_002379 [Physcomitrium patens]
MAGSSLYTGLWKSDDGSITRLKRSCSHPLKVYMYDIPRKFNFGLMTMDNKNEDLPWGNHAAPPWSQQWEVNKQHSVEYWMTVYLLDGWDRKDGRRAAIRVRDPYQADVFFVPFFASLSFNNYGYGMEGPGAELDKNLQECVVNILLNSKWWKASQGRDHVIVLHHPNAFRHYRHLLNSSMLIVADFGRFSTDVACLQKDIVAPYEHVVQSYVDDHSNSFSQRHILLYFQGRIHRKADGIVRAKLAKALMNEKDVHYMDSEASSEALAEATSGMRSSRFCLHPAGDTPSSCRLFDAIVSHCVPVIVSDRIELPFEDDIDYNEFSLFFSSEEAVRPQYLLRILRGINETKWTQMWTKLKAVSHHFEFQHPAKKDDAVNMIFKQVQRS